jgi:hypothetical protein
MSSQILSFKSRQAANRITPDPIRIRLSDVERIVLIGYVDAFRLLLEERSFRCLESLAADFAGWCALHRTPDLQEIAALLALRAQTRLIEESLAVVERLARLAHNGVVLSFKI